MTGRVPDAGAAITSAGVRFVALDRMHGRLEEELTDAFSRVLADSAFTLGAEVERFEAEFAAYCGVAECVGVSSGTAALTLILRANGIGPGDEVIVPAHTFFASAVGIALTGATAVMCDVDPATGLIDPVALAELIGPRTAAIIAVHLYGQACEMDRIVALARARGILVVEDAAQAHGARYRDRRAGSLGDAAGFSFYPSKNLGALGDGGAICTDDAELATRVRRLRNLGQRRKGEHVELAGNERLDGLQAALLRVKLPYLEEWNANRRGHAAHYRALLDGHVTLLHERPESPCTYHLFPIRLRDRDRVAVALAEHGIETGVHYAVPLHLHRVWGERSLRRSPVANAESWAREELSLPMHPDLEPAEIEFVAELLCDLLAPADR